MPSKSLLPESALRRSAPIEKRFMLLRVPGRARRLPDDLKDRHPEIDWAAAAAARNVYRHEYEVVDELQLWNTVQHELSALRRVVIAELGCEAG